MPLLPRYANTMGWFSINILLPVFAPLALLLIAGKICTPIERSGSLANSHSPARLGVPTKEKI